MAIAFATELEMVGGLSPLVFMLGLVLPFGVGLAGIASRCRSIQRLIDRPPITHERRGRIMLRLVFCWGAVSSSVAPVALWRIHDGLYHLMG